MAVDNRVQRRRNQTGTGASASKTRERTNNRAAVKSTSAKAQPRKRRKFKFKKSILVVGALVILLLAGALMLFKDNTLSGAEIDKLMATERYAAGVTVNGVDIAGMTYNEAKAALAPAEDSLKQDYVLELRHDAEKWTLTSEEMGFKLNTDDVLKHALLGTRMGTAAPDVNPTGKSYKLDYAYDKTMVDSAVSKKTEEIDQPAKDPSVDFNKDSSELFTYHEGQNGLEVNKDKLMLDVVSRLDNKDMTAIDLEVHVTTPKKSIEDIKGTTKLIRSFTTNIASSSSANRRTNIRKLAGLLNGQVVKSGAQLSLNGLTGTRTVEGGWPEAPGIADGTYTQQAGGGVCQVSTTLYNCVRRANLEIVDRRHHSWPATYAIEGMDATISTPGGPDFIFRNNQENDIYILCSVGSSTCTVSIYGKPLDYTIDFDNKILERLPAPSAKTVPSKDLPQGTTDTTKKSRDGIIVQVYRIETRNGVKTRYEDHKDTYRAVQGEITIGEGTNTSPSPTIGVSPSPAATGVKPTQSKPRSSDAPKPSANPTPNKTANPTPKPTPVATPIVTSSSKVPVKTAK